jgi:hypothetical protein
MTHLTLLDKKMKTPHLVILGILVLICTVTANAKDYDTLKLKSGKTLFRCTIVGWSPTGALIEHFKGADSVEWLDVPVAVLEDLYSQQDNVTQESIIPINLGQPKEIDDDYVFSSSFRDGLIKIITNSQVLYLNDAYPHLTVWFSYSHDDVFINPISNFLIFSDRIYKIETNFPTPSIIQNYSPTGIGTGTVSISIEDVTYEFNIEIKDRRPEPKKVITEPFNSASTRSSTYTSKRQVSKSDAKREAVVASLSAQSARTAEQHNLAGTALQKAAEMLDDAGLSEMADAARGDAFGEKAIAKYMSGSSAWDFRQAADYWESAARYYRYAGLSSQASMAEAEARKLNSVADVRDRR